MVHRLTPLSHHTHRLTPLSHHTHHLTPLRHRTHHLTLLQEVLTRSPEGSMDGHAWGGGGGRGDKEEGSEEDVASLGERVTLSAHSLHITADPSSTIQRLVLSHPGPMMISLSGPSRA